MDESVKDTLIYGYLRERCCELAVTFKENTGAKSPAYGCPSFSDVCNILHRAAIAGEKIWARDDQGIKTGKKRKIRDVNEKCDEAMPVLKKARKGKSKNNPDTAKISEKAKNNISEECSNLNAEPRGSPSEVGKMELTQEEPIPGKRADEKHKTPKIEIFKLPDFSKILQPDSSDTDSDGAEKEVKNDDDLKIETGRNNSDQLFTEPNDKSKWLTKPNRKAASKEVDLPPTNDPQKSNLGIGSNYESKDHVQQPPQKDAQDSGLDMETFKKPKISKTEQANVEFDSRSNEPYPENENSFKQTAEATKLPEIPDNFDDSKGVDRKECSEDDSVSKRSKEESTKKSKNKRGKAEAGKGLKESTRRAMSKKGQTETGKVLKGNARTDSSATKTKTEETDNKKGHEVKNKKKKRMGKERLQRKRLKY